jgi:hypothetical protein
VKIRPRIQKRQNRLKRRVEKKMDLLKWKREIKKVLNRKMLKRFLLNHPKTNKTVKKIDCSY